MTYVFVAKAKNIPGGLSVFVRCDESRQDIINVLRATQCYCYDAEDGLHEVPLPDLGFVLDRLTFKDDLKLVLQPEEQIPYKSETLAIRPRLEPFKHQLDAVKYGLLKKKWLLLDEPGLGKTFSLIMLAEELHARGLIDHCLIVCGIASLKQNWKREIEKSSSLSCRVSGERVTSTGRIRYEKMAKRKAEVMAGIDEFFFIANIESLRASKAKLPGPNALRKEDPGIGWEIMHGPQKFGMIIFDEAHKAKASQSKAAVGLLSLDAPYLVAATGTPLLNSPEDAYMSLAWIGEERKRNISRFMDVYCEFSKTLPGQVSGYKNLDLLQAEIGGVSLRRTKDVLAEDPRSGKQQPKFVNTVHLAMDSAQADFYDVLERSVMDGATAEDRLKAKELCDKVELKTTSLLSLVTRLRQAVACPGMLTSKAVPSVKLDYAAEFAAELAQSGEKVVILSTFKQPLYELADRLRDFKPFVVTGDSHEEELVEAMREFQSDDSHMIWLGSHAKSGTGYTLNRAHYLIMLDAPWTKGLFDQSADRIHRLDNTGPAFIYNLVCDGTIDDLVTRLIDGKGAISDYVVDNASDAAVMAEIDKYMKSIAGKAEASSRKRAKR